MAYRSDCRRATERGGSHKGRRIVSVNSPKRAAATAALFAFLGSLLMAALGASLWPWPALARAATQELTIEKSSGGSATFTIEVAQSEAEKAKGLMFRTKLGENEGMLFPYGRSQEVTMWMRNTYISLDMLFIRKDGVIHRIEARTEPLSDRVIASEGEVFAVLEIPGGAAERQGIKAGDRVRSSLFQAATPQK